MAKGAMKSDRMEMMGGSMMAPGSTGMMPMSGMMPMMGMGMMNPMMMSMPSMMMGMPGMMNMASMMPGMMPGMMGMGGMMPTMGMMRCRMEMKKVSGGMTLHCMCDDASMTAMMHAMCDRMMGGMPSMMMMANGMPMAMMNMGMMAMCQMEKTEQGMTMTCTSGDEHMAAMMGSMCDMMNHMMECGMHCCLMMNGMPMCCC